MVEFGELTPEGVKNVRSIPQQKLRECPHAIMVPQHYREDNSCRCDDPNHPEMRDWGYVWIGGRWE